MVEEMKKKMRTEEGFTLAELLIVVAIIAVLVAIAIPVFTNQLEKSREATDAANIRSAIAEVTVDYLNADTIAEDGYTVTVSLKQQNDDWQNTTIGFFDSKGNAIDASGTPKKGKTCAVKIDKDGVLSLTYAS